MPIDSAAKRKSIAHLSRKWSGKGITPDASKPGAWRQVAGWGYFGIAAAAGSTFLSRLMLMGMGSYLPPLFMASITLLKLLRITTGW